MRPEVSIHIGAHKTASTHLQRLIFENNDKLASAGVGFYPPWELRRELIPELLKEFRSRNSVQTNDEFTYETVAAKSGAECELRKLISNLFQNFDRVVIADENIIGTCGELYKFGRMYPLVEEKLKILTEYIDADLNNIFLSIRSYDGFLASAYCEAIRSRDFFTFKEFIDNISIDGISWIKLIESVRKITPDANLIVWKYEDYRALESTIVNLMIGKDCYGEFTPRSVDVSYPSPSGKAIEALNAINDILSPAQVRKLVRQVEKAAPKNVDCKGFCPWSKLEVAYLSKKYQADLESIKKIDGVTFLAP